MTPGTFLTVFVAGLIAAWLAASLMKDGGYGLVWDIVLALPGSALAYWIVQTLGTSPDGGMVAPIVDRKSTRLNSSHLVISYAVFCLKKKKNKQNKTGSSILLIKSSLGVVC